MLLGAIVSLSACASRQDSVKAALTLAETNYPGQLELESANLSSDHYQVTFSVRGDAFSRVRFAIDRDPADCRVGTRCETRFRSAYDAGLQAGVKLKAIDQAFRSCGVPALAVYDEQISSALRTVVELDLVSGEPQSALDRLTPCIAAFRQGLPVEADEILSTLLLVVVQPVGPTATPMPTLLSFAGRVDDQRLNTPSYMVAVPASAERATPDMVRLNAHFPRRGLNDALAQEARRVLRAEGLQAHVPEMSFPQIRLDPGRLDVVNAYVLACSANTQGGGPCRTDMAVRLRYHLGDRQVSVSEVLQAIRDADGELNLPPLPGRDD